MPSFTVISAAAMPSGRRTRGNRITIAAPAYYNLRPVPHYQPMTNPYAPPQATVQDIVDPAAGFILADRGTRLGAAILDSLVFGVMVYLPLVGTAVITGVPNRARPASRRGSRASAWR